MAAVCVHFEDSVILRVSCPHCKDCLSECRFGCRAGFDNHHATALHRVYWERGHMCAACAAAHPVPEAGSRTATHRHNHAGMQTSWTAHAEQFDRLFVVTSNTLANNCQYFTRSNSASVMASLASFIASLMRTCNSLISTKLCVHFNAIDFAMH